MREHDPTFKAGMGDTQQRRTGHGNAPAGSDLSRRRLHPTLALGFDRTVQRTVDRAPDRSPEQPHSGS